MEIIADLHIHSRFSRATSPQLTIPNLEKWAKVKGLDLLGTGDFTHPLWLKELKQELKEKEGILKTKTGFPFILQAEISLMYTQDKKGRRVHLLLLAPSFEVVEQINNYLGEKGRLDYDGRPIFGMNCIEFTEAIKEISDDIEVIPAHAWTPWFGVFGSKSGFDSVEECFQDQAKHIYALETGMSADPAMFWRLSKLDKYTTISNSDSHSHWPWRLGREANVFELDEINYRNIVNTIRTRQIKETIEVDPAYGKYHYDGHRLCNFSCSPKEAEDKYKNICPVCKKQLTIGVEHRVEELADRELGFRPPKATPFRKLLPLHEIIANLFRVQLYSKRAWREYDLLIDYFKNEFNVLLKAHPLDLARVTDDRIVQAIIKNRQGKIKVKPGYDGLYGEMVLEDSFGEKQKRLFDI